jgi:NAD(P)-dependent dehydrogenase (short-subunit alcohol dehydrogenase family)
MLLQNKTVIITGTNRGIGKAMIEAFAANGANIYAHARAETPEFLEVLDRLSIKYEVKISPWCFELTNYDAMKAKVKEIVAQKELGFTTEVAIDKLPTDRCLELPRLDTNDFPPKSENYKALHNGG